MNKTDNRKIKNKLITSALYLIFVAGAILAMALNYYRISSILFLISILIVGIGNNWSKNRIRKFNPLVVNSNVFLCWILGLYGVWWDFISGILYFLWAFFILILTNHYHNENIFRGIIIALSLLFSIASLILFLIYDIGLLE